MQGMRPARQTILSLALETFLTNHNFVTISVLLNYFIKGYLVLLTDHWSTGIPDVDCVLLFLIPLGRNIVSETLFDYDY